MCMSLCLLSLHSSCNQGQSDEGVPLLSSLLCGSILLAMTSCSCSLAGALLVAHLLLSNSHQSLMLTREHHASISQPPVDKPRKKQK